MKFTAEICDTETIFIDTVIKLPRLAQHSTKKLSLMQRRILNGNLQVQRRTFRERPPKMQTLRGRLQESNSRGPLPRRGGSGTSEFMKDYLLHTITPCVFACSY